MQIAEVAGPNVSEINNEHLTRVSNAIENIGYVATICFMSETRLYVQWYENLNNLV